MAKIRALLGGALLLVAGTCFAQEWVQGELFDAKNELAGLSESGRTAFFKALYACSLYVNEPDNATYKNACKIGEDAFVDEFENAHPILNFHPISNLFFRVEMAMGAYTLEKHASDWNFARDIIAGLLRAFNETNPSVASANTTSPPASDVAGQILIPLQRKGGTFVVPVQINKAITLNFVVDSGAADVTIPSDVVSTLVRTGTVQDTDFIGTQTYKLADGSTIPSRTFRIRSLTVNIPSCPLPCCTVEVIPCNNRQFRATPMYAIEPH